MMMLLSMTLPLLALVVSSAAGAAEFQSEWQEWKRVHNKVYTDYREEMKSFQVWRQSVTEVADHNLRFNLGLETYEKALNQFSDATWDELEAVMFPAMIPELEGTTPEDMMPKVNVSGLPDSVDWVKKGYVTKVKDQGSCGSCWAFSTAGALEGLMKKKNLPIDNLSPQQLVDCSTKNHGCNGGWPNKAMKYTAENGVEASSAYPYRGKKGQCAYKESDIKIKNKNYIAVSGGTEDRLKELVANNGPTTICLVSTPDLSHYRRGVFTTHRCLRKAVNHAVLAVGYGSENGQDYWLIKNSWGPGWGERGYVKFARNKQNMCQVASNPAVPI